MKFDPSGLTQAMDRMRENAAGQGRTLSEQMSKVFLADMKEQGRMIAPTPDTLVQKAKSLKWRLKRKPGVTPGKELARRIRARGTFARKWKIWKTEGEKYNIRIWLIDTAANSGIVDEQKGVSKKAERITGNKYKSRLGALAQKLMGSF